ncbi:MAG: antibiotic biosynthesis monooxygenase [Flavobacteriales bacterium]|nr:antibiotic biosynthesis monooxygenase [Flavobacteriales bacterium]
MYSFRVKPGHEEVFQRNWAMITEHYLHTRGSHGSRLHTDKDGTFVAIALWPDRASWGAHGHPDSPELNAARAAMRDACTEVKTQYELEVVQDL